MRNTGSSLKNNNNNPVDPVVKTPSFYCRGHTFDPCSGNGDLRASQCCQKFFLKVFFNGLRMETDNS